MFNDKSILITGGTGSFGQQYVGNLLKNFKPRRLVIYSRDELKQYEMEQELRRSRRMRYFIGDVRDRERLTQAMRGVDFVIHAAALKQVPAAEYNPMECIKTNIHGAENVIQAALDDRGREGHRAVDRQGRATRSTSMARPSSPPTSCSSPPTTCPAGTGPRFARRALRQRGRLARLGRAVLPQADRRRRRSPADHRRAHDALLDHAAAGRRLRAARASSACTAARSSCRRSRRCASPTWPQAMAPDLPTKVVGIRPGEKLHEIMCPADDSHLTLEFHDHFVIRPTIQFFRSATSTTSPTDSARTASRCPTGFEYNSGSNARFLDVARDQRNSTALRGRMIPYGRQDISRGRHRGGRRRCCARTC